MSAAIAGTMGQGRGPDAARERDRAGLSVWLGVIAGSLGSLMATLDVSIVNSSLPVIQGEIGATAAEGTWIATSFLVAEIIIIPLTGWFDRLLGLRRFLLIAAVLFTGFSIMCGMSTTLLAMIVGRAGQGITGGAMIPTAMTIVATRLPPAQQPIGMALFGGTALVGPVLGPVAGGWLTENFSWHYAFFVNVPICAILIVLLVFGLPGRRMQWSELAHADWLGIAGMALGLGCLTVILEEGHREHWFESSLIWWLAVAMIAGFLLVALGQLTARRPVVRLALLGNRGFSATMVMSVMLGAVLFGTAFVIPQFLVTVAGYNAVQSGGVVLLAGIPAILMMPFLPLLVAKVDVRLLVALGFLTMAASCWFDSGLTASAGGESFVEGQLLRGIGQSLCMMFLNQAAISAVGTADAGDATSLFNAVRNLGGSICLALLATLQEERLEFHRWNLHYSLQANDFTIQSLNFIDPLGGVPGANYTILDAAVTQQASVMAFNDSFYAMAIAIACVVPFAFLLTPLRRGRGLMAAH